MIEYMKRHERYVRDLLAAQPGKGALGELLEYHDKQIAWIQHERMAHLITMMFVCLFFLLSFAWTIAHLVIPYILLTALLLVLSAAYILHYYRLENGVQGWYLLSNEIRMRRLEMHG